MRDGGERREALASAGVDSKMTATNWSIRIVAAAFVALPLPVPLPTPGEPSVSVPVTVQVSPLPVATPSLPLGATPASQAAAPTSGAAGASGRAVQPPSRAGAGGGSASNPGGVPIPFTAIYVSSPLDIALLVAVAALPLLFGIWLLVFGRTFAEARRRRDAQVRLILAADLGLHPRDLTSMNTKALFDLREKAAFDELTGVLRRAAGVSMAEREIARARRHNTALTVAFIDVDGLKEANDAEGHATGDALLRALAQALREGMRGEDIILRYGGDEFVCVLPDTTARAARLKLGAIQDEAALQGVRFCAGLAQLQRGDDVVSLFARADGDLYDFKVRRGEIVPLPARPGDTAARDTVTA